MNRHTLQRIILEELSSTRPTLRPPRRLGLVDYLGEGSERNLLELSDDAVISTGRSLCEVGDYDPIEAGRREAERMEDQNATVNLEPATATMAMAPAPPVEPAQQEPPPNEDEVVLDDKEADERAWAEDEARKKSDAWREEVQALRGHHPDGPRGVVANPAPAEPEPDPDAPPTINNRAAIDAIDSAAEPPPTLDERRHPSLIDLLYT